MSDNTDVHVTKQSTFEHDLAGTNTMLSQVGKSKGIRLALITRQDPLCQSALVKRTLYFL